MQMKYAKKFQGNANCRNIKVGRRVFKTVREAELYCAAKDLDVDLVTEHEDTTEFINQVMEIARIQNTILKDILSTIDQALEDNRKEIDRRVKRRDDAMSTRDLLRDYYKDQVAEAVHTGSGISQARTIVSNASMLLSDLHGWGGI